MVEVRFTDREKAACARREVAMRERVYPNWVLRQKMTQAQADKEIAMMREIAAEYEVVDHMLEFGGGDAGPFGVLP